MPTLKEIINYLDNTNSSLEKIETSKAQHKEIDGYAPRCKVCNHPDVDKIESLRERNWTYENIIEELNLDMSMMSLSRHFKEHYPKRTKHKLKRKKLMLESVVKVIEKYPYLEEYFKDKDYEEIKVFTEDYGFCTDCFKLCELIPPNEVLDSDKVQINLSKLINKDLERGKYEFYINKPDEFTAGLLLDKERCLNCKNNILTERLDMLEKLISTLILDIPDIKPNELLYTFKVKYNNDRDLFYEDVIIKNVKKK